MKRLAVIVSLTLAACSPPAPKAPEAPPPVVAAPISAVMVEAAIAHPPLGGQTTGVGYMTIRNAGEVADRLLGASSPAAQSIELHTHRDVDGMKRMERVDGVDVPVGGAAEFKPGGLHLMFFGFAPVGKNAPVTLRFEKAGEVTTFFKVVARSVTPQKTGQDGTGHASD